MPNLFSTIWNGYNNTLVQGAVQNVSAGLSAVAAIIQAVLGLYVLITGGMMLFGGMSFDVGIRRVVRALLVAAVLTPANYNQWVVQTFTQTLPDWIAQSVGQGGSNASGAQQFDTLRQSVIKMVADIKTQATGLSYIAARIEIALAGMFCELALLLCFVIWFLSRAAMALVVCIGPFVIPFYLFDATKGVPERWIGKLIDYAILILLVLVVLQIVQTQDASLIGQAAAPTSGNVDEMVDILWNVALSFGVGAFLLIMLPAIAATIGGGVGFSTGPIVGLLFRVPGNLLGKR